MYSYSRYLYYICKPLLILIKEFMAIWNGKYGYLVLYKT